jgi:rhodanese-related sulfurtransferase
MTPTIAARQVRAALVARDEIALVDVRDEDVFALGHPLFAAQLPADRVNVEAAARLPRRDARIVLYDDGQGAVERAAERLRALGYSRVHALARGLSGWRDEGFELFQDVNSSSKAFGELVEARRQTPSLSAHDVASLLDAHADVAVLDARRFDEYRTMSIPTAVSVPGADLVLRASTVAPDPRTTIVVNCAGRTRSIIGTQSLINAGIGNRVVALRNGTIGWTLAGRALDKDQSRLPPPVSEEAIGEARWRARAVSYRAGVRRIAPADVDGLASGGHRTLYRFDVRTPEEYAAGHWRGFASAPGGQLVQEIDWFAPVRGARVVLADELGVRADMTASWLAQMGCDVYVLDDGPAGPIEAGAGDAPPPRPARGRYRRPYEGTAHSVEAMEAYLRWEHGLVDQLARDATHGFFVI